MPMKSHVHAMTMIVTNWKRLWSDNIQEKSFELMQYIEPTEMMMGRRNGVIF